MSSSVGLGSHADKEFQPLTGEPVSLGVMNPNPLSARVGYLNGSFVKPFLGLTNIPENLEYTQPGSGFVLEEIVEKIDLFSVGKKAHLFSHKRHANPVTPTPQFGSPWGRLELLSEKSYTGRKWINNFPENRDGNCHTT